MKPVGEISRCPEADEGQTCATSHNGFRERVTGPGFPIQVMKCASHGRAFTVYPPGFLPYGRQRIAPVAAGGDVLEADGPVAGIDERWHGTLFRCGRDSGRF